MKPSNFGGIVSFYFSKQIFLSLFLLHHLENVKFQIVRGIRRPQNGVVCRLGAVFHLAEALVAAWTRRVASQFDEKKGFSKKDMAANFAAIAADFAAVPVTYTPKVKVGVVGEIYVKYSPLGNNNLEQFLHGEDCEVNLPGLMGFVQYCVANMAETVRLYGGSKLLELGSDTLMSWLTVREKLMIAAIKKHPQFHAPTLFLDTKKMADGILGIGNKMGEGWLLTAEMVELIQHYKVNNIVCTQPFGCLPNHICGKGVMRVIKEKNPQANIVAVDYDSSASKVNQQNRIKLMLANARLIEQTSQQPKQGNTPAAPQQETVAAAPQRREQAVAKENFAAAQN